MSRKGDGKSPHWVCHIFRFFFFFFFFAANQTALSFAQPASCVHLHSTMNLVRCRVEVWHYVINLDCTCAEVIEEPMNFPHQHMASTCKPGRLQNLLLESHSSALIVPRNLLLIECSLEPSLCSSLVLVLWDSGSYHEICYMY